MLNICVQIQRNILNHIFVEMNKIKHLLLLVCIAGCFTACKKTEFNAEKQFTADTTAIRNFIIANNIPAVKDPSGVFYQIITPGTGTVTYSSSTKVNANYEGKLLNGSIFDSSKGTPIQFTLGGVIVGWQIAIPKIQKGGSIRMFIPSYYGYANSSVGSIPENSVLDFTVSLTDVQ